MTNLNDDDNGLVFCAICGEAIAPWDERDEWHGRIAHAECVAQQDVALDPEEMEALGYDE